MTTTTVQSTTRAASRLLFTCLLTLGCDAGDAGDDADADTETGSSSETDDASSTSSPDGEGALDPDDFDPFGLAGEITVVDCTLSNGEESSCYSIPIVGAPSDHDVGPFCPRNIADGDDVAGIWLESGDVFDVDGSFIETLAEFYDDAMWQLFDPETGDIFVTDSQVACEAAARPDVSAEYNNYCVECSLDYYGGGVAQEVLIPVSPVRRDAPSEIGGMNNVGVALNGVTMDPPAPVDAILAAYTIAAFDDCGGHVNPVAGYHYHAAMGCLNAVAQADGHAPRIGYALDGYGIHAMVGDDAMEPDDLDACRGHEDEARGYHYHVASPGENMFIGCFAGEISGDDGAAPDGPPDGPPGGELLGCDEVPAGMPCCGDGSCDAPIEDSATCAEDCA